MHQDEHTLMRQQPETGIARPGAQTVPVGRPGLIPAIGLAAMACGAATALPLASGLELKVAQIFPVGSVAALWIMDVLSGAVMLAANPLSGYLSDRTTSRFGMRRPWILGGALLTLLGLVTMALAGSVPLLILSVLTIAGGTQAMLAGLAATIVDQFAPAQRTRVAGVFASCTLGGTVPALIIGGLFHDELPAQLLLVGVLAVASAAGLCALLPDRRRDPADRDTALPTPTPTPAPAPARAAADFRLLWAQQLLVGFGIALIGADSHLSVDSYLYLQSRLGEDGMGTAVLAGAMGLTGIVLSALFAYAAGRWAQRAGRGRQLLRWSTVVLAAVLLLKAVAAGLVLVILGAVVSGAAIGVYCAACLGLVTRALPDERRAGGYLGAFALAGQLPLVLMPVLASLVVHLGADPVAGGLDYFLLFLLGGLLTLAAAPLVGRLREVQ